MPIEIPVPLKLIDQDAFHAIDRRVTGLAFDIHNEFGRYLDETHYQDELARRCRAVGFEVIREMRIAVSLDDFCKSYLVDLMLDRCVVVETKTVAALSAVHRAQTLNYLFLCGLRHGTLLNFRTERVQHEFISTSIDHSERRRWQFVDAGWQELTPRCRALQQHLARMLNEWGAFLDPCLYRDGLVHFLGGERDVCRPVLIYSGNDILGVQHLRMVGEDVAFSVTASIHHPQSVLQHQRRFLAHTKLKAIQWINFNHHDIELRTILSTRNGRQASCVAESGARYLTHSAW